MKFSDQIIEEIRSQANIVDVIGDYITLEKRGRNHLACCPFHQEDTPSFSVSEEKQLFHCFGCHEAGNVFSFPMKYEGLSFQEAVLHVAKYTNVDVSQVQGQFGQQRISPQQEYYDLMQFVSEFYAYILQTDKGKVAKNYLQKRGITTIEIEAFRIGFAPDEQVLANLLEEKGYSLEKARELGLVFESKDLTQYYDAFRGRIVFPITDTQGNIVAFSGRILDETLEKEKPKYFHSPENIIFKKREILYNYSFVKNEIKKIKEVYVCEGIFDVIALARANVKNAICTLGTALTREQLQLLGQMKSTVTFVFDNDNAGKNAMLKALRLSVERKIEAKAVTFWQYAEKDLDEFMTAFGAAKVRELVEEKQTVNDYYLQYYQNSLNLANNEDKQEFVKKMIEILQYSNRPTQEHYYQIIKDDTGYSDKALDELLKMTEKIKEPELVKRRNEQMHGHVETMTRSTGTHLTGQTRNEKLIIKGLLRGNEYIEIYKSNPAFSQNKVFRDIIWKITDYFALHNNMIDFLDFNESLEQAEMEFLLQAFSLDEPITPTIFKDLLLSLQKATEMSYLKEEAIQTKNKDKAQQVDAIQQLADFKRKINKSEEK